MNEIDWSGANVIAPEELPGIITDYLKVHQARDVAAAMSYYSPDAVVTDEGHDYRGKAEIGAWLGKAASEYTYTSTLTSAHRLDPDHFDVAHRLEGNFPGGVADLHFRFTLDGDGHVTRLVIEP
ncbi:MAG TPA: nuclear transport factor 2 family protein [Actinospica sp.]|jgi:hypothetical protein|nr:nuclear transport factor 2 family protein [Actinospica sp.]